MKRLSRNVLSITIAVLIAFFVCISMKNLTVNAINTDDIEPEYKAGDIIEFGTYPQTEITESSLISELDSSSEGVDWISYDYYIVTDDYRTYNYADGQMKPSDYMKYKDFWYSGTKYRAVTFSQHRPARTGYPSTYTIQDDNGYYPNNVYFFKYEPLKWRILDSEEGLVMCENIIDSQAYNNYVLRENSKYWGDSSKTYYSTNWAKCSLRQWLNDDFYNTTFSPEEKNAIKTSYLENKSTLLSLYDAPSTYDKIFLLSYDDAINSNYGFGVSGALDTARQAQGSDYAKCQGLCLSNGCWRLRSTSDSYNTLSVYYDGGVCGNFDTDCTDDGIRPALKIDFKTLFAKVRSVSIEDITINYKSSTTLNPQITADNGASYTVTYSSSNPYVVSVDQSGKVTSQKQSGFSIGSATITVTVTDSNGNTVQDSCNVSVEYVWWQWFIKILLFGWIWY